MQEDHDRVNLRSQQHSDLLCTILFYNFLLLDARPSWRETATTTLHMGHFIETMPFDPRNKSNNRLFLQQGQAT